MQRTGAGGVSVTPTRLRPVDLGLGPFRTGPSPMAAQRALQWVQAISDPSKLAFPLGFSLSGKPADARIAWENRPVAAGKF